MRAYVDVRMMNEVRIVGMAADRRGRKLMVSVPRCCFIHAVSELARSGSKSAVYQPLVSDEALFR